ncbi:hypothetical protein RS130_20655 [Paraglaciecola aquimarina]|uniref:Uncharacterized protein n=1 Tax=Paraglaciecola aquimarina TaxID=1235557 RepID=A0ABU3T132_9ALTE|nr:hypothetical protein [Paraglaciecola aquimarina]MDU0355979.1 hypothetical protein [Paraglaciecola aquimarina]
MDRIVFVMDDDAPLSRSAEVTFRNLKFYENQPDKLPKGSTLSTIRVGLANN